MESLESLVNESLAIREISLISDDLGLEITRLLSLKTKNHYESARIHLALTTLIKVYMNFLDHLERFSNLPLEDKEFLLNSGIYSMKGNLDNFIKSSKLYSDKIKNFKIINENDFRPENE